MTTASILPIESVGGVTTYQAVSCGRMAEGETAGQALDALTRQFPDVERDSLLIVRRLRADEFFTADQQARLQALLEKSRVAHQGGGSLPPEERSELEALVEVEVVASGRRAAAVAQELGR